jgi:nucleotide-binding universal stress UspA family protein
MNGSATLLVPVDFSECSKTALRYAVTFAASLGARLDVLHVWEPRAHGPAGAAVAPTAAHSPETVRATARAEACKQLKRFLLGLRIDSKQPITPRVEVGEPHEIILTLAEQGGCDLIVLGSRGRGGLSKLLVGSVAERVLRHAICPVLLIGASVRDRTETVKASGF